MLTKVRFTYLLLFCNLTAYNRLDWTALDNRTIWDCRSNIRRTWLNITRIWLMIIRLYRIVDLKSGNELTRQTQ